MKREIILLSCWPRSGGTLLNKILVKSKELIVLSEINLRYPSSDERYTVRWQLKNWYRIDVPENMDIIEVLDYVSKVYGNKIIIRGYDLIDFIPRMFNNFNPSKKINNREILRYNFTIKHFAFIRYPLDIYKSMITSSHKMEDPDFIFYHEYIKELIRNNVRLFFYDDLCRNPRDETKKIFNYLGLDFSSLFLEGLDTEKRVLGDILPHNGSRGYNSSKVLILREKALEKDLNMQLKNKFDEINRDISSAHGMR